jgi:hypothetical protein
MQRKNKKMFSSSKIQNGSWNQDGGENVFFILKFQKFQKTHSKWDLTWHFFTLANRLNFFNMFVLKTAYSVFEIFSRPFFMALEVFKEKPKKINLKTRK